MPRLRDLLPTRPPREAAREDEPGSGVDAEQRIADQIRFLREQELRRARTSVPPPRL